MNDKTETPTEDTSDQTKLIYCSFCGKTQNEVEKMITGPSVNICNECVDVCNDVIEESRKNQKLTTDGE